MNDLIYASASELARAIRGKEVSSLEVVDAYVEQIKKVNPGLNAVVQLSEEQARARARAADVALQQGQLLGPLHGVPFTVKDSVEVAGVISTGGTLARASYVPPEDATVVRRMREAGAIFLGASNVPELVVAYESDNLVYGRTNNPYDLSRTCGGSSGGEAAAIAAGESPFGIGSDMAGSIRLPSHFCGIAGLMPTDGRVPKTGDFPPPAGPFGRLTHIGPMARYVEDLILMLPVISGTDGVDPSAIPMPPSDPAAVQMKHLRAAFFTDNGIAKPTDEIAEVVRAAAKALEDAGLPVEEARPEGIEQSNDLMLGLWGADGGIWVDMLLKTADAGIDAFREPSLLSKLQFILQMARSTKKHPLLKRLEEIIRPYGTTAAQFHALLIRWTMFRGQMLAFFNKYDVFICPPCAVTALPHGTAMDDDKLAPFSHTISYNLTGWPSAVVRAGTSSEGLPIGVQVVSAPWREDIVLTVAKYLESIFGGWQPPPPPADKG